MLNSRINTFPFVVFGLLLLAQSSSLNAQSEQSDKSALQGQQEKGSTDKNPGKSKKAEKLKMALKVKAIYPEEALEKEIQGKVKVKFTVSVDGQVVKAKAVSGHKLLRKAALDALLQSRFSNAFKKNVDATMTYYFKIKDDEEMVSDSEVEQADGDMSPEEQGLKLIEKVEPVYPQEAKDKGVEGDVIIEVMVNENGEVFEVEVKDGPEILYQAAIEAAKKYRFLNPQKRSVTATIAISFEL